MDIKAFLNESLQKVLNTYPELFVVGTEHQENKGLYVFVLDGDTGLNIAQCGEISRKLMNLIEQNPEAEAERERFSFGITSPGADAPLVLPRQYQKHSGRELMLTLQDDAKLSAKLKEITTESITVVTLIKSKVKGRSDKEGEEKVIPFNQIKESKIILSFK
ncbi:MAG: hypothetical protein LC109_00040 [Bacteroidia bacterium]|nr:hypothetical protein [Bacteroidia bacterium]MCO5254000.1 hypothetical protein [Bacteroidota bacterium]MCZ2128639.1 hypothetical protein [Bacteroidia bacterium]